MKQTKISRIRALTLTIMAVGKKWVGFIIFFKKKNISSSVYRKIHDRNKCVGPTMLFFS